MDSYLLLLVMDVLNISCVHVSMFAHRGFGGDDMGLLDLMPANISPGAISFAMKCMMEGGWSVL